MSRGRARRTRAGDEVTYSYIGPPLASDEHANSQFTFSVYFRPDELDPTQIQQISNGERALAAEWFGVRISREMTERASIDDAASTFCAGHYVDGNWVHDDPGCQDDIKLHETAQPSDYLAVQVSVDRQVRTAGNIK